MKYLIKKILKETYNHQLLNSICEKLTSGSNQKSVKFMEDLKNLINDSEELTDEVKKECNSIFNKWENDMFYGVQNGRTNNSGTGDSESDESNGYFRQIQSIICGKFMLAMD